MMPEVCEGGLAAVVREKPAAPAQAVCDVAAAQAAPQTRSLRAWAWLGCLMLLGLSGLAQLPVMPQAWGDAPLTVSAHYGAAAGLVALGGRKGAQSLLEKSSAGVENPEELSTEEALHHWMVTFLACALLTGAALGLHDAGLLNFTPALEKSLSWAHAGIASMAGLSAFLIWGRKRWRGA